MKPIPNYERYLITEDGQVFSTKSNKLLRQYDVGKGYKAVELWNSNGGKRHTIHRLVALTYLPNPDSLPFINHKDLDKTNNHVSNLEWCTAQLNVLHAINSGVHAAARNRKLDVDKQRVIRKLHKEGLSTVEIAKRIGVSQTAVSHFLIGYSYKNFAY
jgi:hypothetical protein